MAKAKSAPRKPELNPASVLRLNADGWPHALIKALTDSFDYALRLRTGELVFFSDAVALNREWVRLEFGNLYGHAPDDINREAITNKFPLDRGLEVRVADIVWVADAPYGS